MIAVMTTVSLRTTTFDVKQRARDLAFLRGHANVEETPGGRLRGVNNKKINREINKISLMEMSTLFDPNQ